MPTSLSEIKSEPVLSSKQEFDHLKSLESAKNPFKDIVRHNSPPNTTIVFIF